MAFGQISNNTETCCISNLRETGIKNASLDSLSIEFKRLKLTTDKCCEKWNSDMHQIMSALKEILGKEGTSIKKITHYMGKPDGNERTIQPGLVKTKKGEKILVYQWRGYHDFVYFVYSQNTVKFSGWYNAWE
jgi:hypothetical protein